MEERLSGLPSIRSGWALLRTFPSAIWIPSQAYGFVTYPDDVLRAISLMIHNTMKTRFADDFLGAHQPTDFVVVLTPAFTRHSRADSLTPGTIARLFYPIRDREQTPKPEAAVGQNSRSAFCIWSFFQCGSVKKDLLIKHA